MPDLIRIANTHLSVEVNAVGAETHSLRDAKGQDWLWHGDPAWWAGRAPILFPIVGETVGGRIGYGAREAQMGRHGFARKSLFDLAEAGPTRCTHVLRASAETRAAYPFEFVLRLTHELDGPSLRVTAEVENRGDGPMPFGFGFHPAFAWPLPGGEAQPHGVWLANGAEPALVRLGEGGLLRRTPLPSPFNRGALDLAQELFEADAMVFPEGAGDALRYGVEDGPGLRLVFENLPMLALWQKPGAPYLCIEPWQGMAAWEDGSIQIADRPGTQSLAPGAVANFAFTVAPE